MLPKKYRLATKDFELFGQGKTSLFSCNLFSLFARFDNTLPNPKFGFVVSKKCDSRAVYRNRIKRVLSSVIEKRLLDIKKKGWFVFYAKKDIITANHEEIFNLVDKAISKIPVV